MGYFARKTKSGRYSVIFSGSNTRGGPFEKTIFKNLDFSLSNEKELKDFLFELAESGVKEKDLISSLNEKYNEKYFKSAKGQKETFSNENDFDEVEEEVICVFCKKKVHELDEQITDENEGGTFHKDCYDTFLEDKEDSVFEFIGIVIDSEGNKSYHTDICNSIEEAKEELVNGNYQGGFEVIIEGEDSKIVEGILSGYVDWNIDTSEFIGKSLCELIDFVKNKENKKFRLARIDIVGNRFIESLACSSIEEAKDKIESFGNLDGFRAVINEDEEIVYGYLSGYENEKIDTSEFVGKNLKELRDFVKNKLEKKDDVEEKTSLQKEQILSKRKDLLSRLLGHALGCNEPYLGEDIDYFIEENFAKKGVFVFESDKVAIKRVIEENYYFNTDWLDWCPNGIVPNSGFNKEDLRKLGIGLENSFNRVFGTKLSLVVKE